MADCGGGGGWLGSWVQAAKEKSSQAYEFMKHDLQEFTSVVTEETTKVAKSAQSKLTQENVSAATEKAKKGMSTIIGGISKALVIEPDDLDDPGIPITSDGIFDRKKARLRAIQLDTGTYLNEPTASQDQYEVWKSSFDIDSKKGDISELLVANVEVRALYTQMVPSTVSHADFWQRYFFKVHQLDEDEQRKKLLMQRAEETNNDADLAWDEEDEWTEVSSSPQKSSPIEQTKASQIPVKPSTVQSRNETQASPSEVKPELPIASDEKLPLKDVGQQKETPPLSTGSVTAGSCSLPAGDLVSPTETLSISTTDSLKDIAQGSSLDTLTIVSPESATTTDSVSFDNVDVSDGAVGTENNTVVEESSSADIENKQEENVIEDNELKTREKGELVVVGTASDRTTPSSDSAGSNNTKESSTVDDDWEQDFDIEVTEEDLKYVDLDKDRKLLQELENDENNDDWESWE